MWFRLSLLMILLPSLVACGFHLRGYTTVPDELKLLFVDTKGLTPEFKRIIEDSLTLNKIVMVKDPEAAPYALLVSNEKIDQNVLTLNRSDTNTNAGEFELVAHVNFSLVRQDGVAIINNDTLESRRSYTNDVNNIIGKEEEARRYRQDIRNELMRRILLKLQALNYEKLHPVKKEESQDTAQGDSEPTPISAEAASSPAL